MIPAENEVARALATPSDIPVRVALRSAVILAIFTAISTLLLAVSHTLTRPVMEASLRAKRMRAIEEILPHGIYDNDLVSDVLRLDADPSSALNVPSVFYRGRRNGAPAVLVVETSARGGYGGPIGLLIGIRADGTLLGVRVTEHRETPGLGDYIDPKKDKNRKNPWIAQFGGLSFGARPESEWKVRKDGGSFDFIAGATVSPRAIVRAVRDTLKFVAERHETLYGVPEKDPVTALSHSSQGDTP
ncbi:MAG: RnfABCDGE type electron transport complex subunit G [Candidatus Accumulibacter sp.]|jgi:electron transport complex protein RnfG|nr:RnfABCDGE type electron transport complex subunit G [Accumulibacter sp.]